MEVANLTRNIVFRGDPDSAVAAAGRGIHMMIMKHMDSSPQEVHVDAWAPNYQWRQKWPAGQISISLALAG